MIEGVYWVAAEGRQRTPGGGISGGGSITPAGMLHAVDPATEVVLCGEPLRALIPFRNMKWSLLQGGVRCRDCKQAADDS